MAIYPSLTAAYAKAIYIDGAKRFSGIRPEYVEPVMQYAADKYYIDDLQDAAQQGWITDEEAAETLLLKGPEDPQYRPAITSLTADSEVV
jgi:hypothetical protein